MTRRDDMISHFYVLIKLLYVNLLPWSNLESVEEVAQIKKDTLGKYVTRLKFNEEPNYKKLVKSLRDIFKNGKFKSDDEYI
jgi:hypothetical protein